MTLKFLFALITYVQTSLVSYIEKESNAVNKLDDKSDDIADKAAIKATAILHKATDKVRANTDLAVVKCADIKRATKLLANVKTLSE